MPYSMGPVPARNGKRNNDRDPFLHRKDGAEPEEAVGQVRGAEVRPQRGPGVRGHPSQPGDSYAVRQNHSSCLNEALNLYLTDTVFLVLRKETLAIRGVDGRAGAGHAGSAVGVGSVLGRGGQVS